MGELQEYIGVCYSDADDVKEKTVVEIFVHQSNGFRESFYVYVSEIIKLQNHILDDDSDFLVLQVSGIDVSDAHD